MQNFRSNPAQRRDHYQELTEKIIVALEAGTAPWRRPWDKTACGGAVAPVNAATGHRYHGINLFVLGMSPLAFASNDPRWCTYRQAGSRGWQVRKGEKATPVYFYKPIEIEDQTSGSGRETRRIPMLRTRKFHFAIYAAASMPLLFDMIEKLWIQVGAFFALSMSNKIDRLKDIEAFQHHRDLVVALEHGDSARARQAIADDIRDAASRLLTHEIFAPPVDDVEPAMSDGKRAN